MASGEVGESERYVLDLALTGVWGGLPREHIKTLVDDVAEGNCDLAWVMRLVDEELRKKREEEGSWPGQTDCDRLDVGSTLCSRKGSSRSRAQVSRCRTAHRGRRVRALQPERRLDGYCFHH